MLNEFKNYIESQKKSTKEHKERRLKHISVMKKVLNFLDYYKHYKKVDGRLAGKFSREQEDANADYFSREQEDANADYPSSFDFSVGSHFTIHYYWSQYRTNSIKIYCRDNSMSTVVDRLKYEIASYQRCLDTPCKLDKVEEFLTEISKVVHCFNDDTDLSYTLLHTNWRSH